MSTIPGDDSWTDAGLVPPVGPEPPADEADAETEPGSPRPDLRGEATEPDVVEQSLPAGEDEDDEYREA